MGGRGVSRYLSAAKRLGRYPSVLSPASLFGHQPAVCSPSRPPRKSLPHLHRASAPPGRVPPVTSAPWPPAPSPAPCPRERAPAWHSPRSAAAAPPPTAALLLHRSRATLAPRAPTPPAAGNDPPRCEQRSFLPARLAIWYHSQAQGHIRKDLSLHIRPSSPAIFCATTAGSAHLEDRGRVGGAGVGQILPGILRHVWQQRRNQRQQPLQ